MRQLLWLSWVVVINSGKLTFPWDLLYQPPEALTLPTLPAVGIARRVGGRRRAEQRLIPTVILQGRWY
jgi:hypothetical protein